jgi:hypothetical protein
VNRYSQAGAAEFLAREYDERHDVLLLDVSELSKDASSYGMADVRAIALHKSEDDVSALIRGIAATAELDRLEKAVAVARRYVMQTVRGRSRIGKRLGWVPGHQLRALDRMQFDAVRLAQNPWLDENEYRLKTFSRAGLRVEHEGVGTLSEDWSVHLKRRVDYVLAEVRVLREAFQSRIAYALQWVGLVVATASVLLALPAEWRVWVFWPLVAVMVAGLFLSRFRRRPFVWWWVLITNCDNIRTCLIISSRGGRAGSFFGSSGGGALTAASASSPDWPRCPSPPLIASWMQCERRVSRVRNARGLRSSIERRLIIAMPHCCGTLLPLLAMPKRRSAPITMSRYGLGSPASVLRSARAR